jgi:hypothetical protein
MVLMIATPCLAQEIETGGIFPIEGTRWQGCPTLMILPSPHIGCNESGGYEIGFYQRKVYNSMVGGFNPAMRSFYVDMLGVSTYFANTIAPPTGTIWETGFMFPAVGLGIGVTFGSTHLIIPIFSISILNKAEDNWIPPEYIFMISPFQGEQGTTLRDVTIWSANTTFQDNSPVEVIFDPPEGLTISNINVKSNNNIGLDLEIAADAPLGTKLVIVIYDNGKKVVDSSEEIWGDGGFEVTGPPEQILSISPNQGEQGTTLTGVTIMTEHTTLEDDGVRTILLMPPSGLTVSNINVISNTEIEFDLEIPVDAPVGSKEVYVALSDDTGYVGNSEVFFEITGKTN